MGRVIRPREDDAAGDSASRREQALESATRAFAKLVTGLILIATIPPIFWLVTTAHIARASIATDGEIVAKDESILLSGDWARRLFQITYRYRPSDAMPSEASHNVDLATYNRLHIGQTVRIRYATSALLRAWAGAGSYIEGTSPWVRTRFGPTPARDLTVGGAVLAAVLVGLLALVARSASAGVVALLLAGAAFPMVLLVAVALLGVPWLFWASIRRPRQGYGWMLLGLVGATMGIVYWGVPHPEPMPDGPQQTTTAIVRQAKRLDRIWQGAEIGPSRIAGEHIRHPFQIVDLEFTPAGASERVHALDRIDADSIPGLAPGVRIPVSYAILDSRAARIVGATRTYDRAVCLELMEMAGVLTLIMTFVAFPIGDWSSRAVDRLRRFATDTAARYQSGIGSAEKIPPRGRQSSERQR